MENAIHKQKGLVTIKRLICLILALCTSLAVLCGCQNTDGNTQNTTDITTEPTTEPTTEATEPTEPFALKYDSLLMVNPGEAWSIYDGPRDKTMITWASENESVATITEGMVIAVGDGETTVYAFVDGQKYECIVTCQFQDVSEDDRAPVLVPPEMQTVDASFFDDAVFIGDSVSVGLGYYAAMSGDLGKATFLARTSYGVSNAVYDIMLMTYRGREYKIEQALELCQPGKIFIMLGTNDVGGYDHDLLIKRWGMLLTRIRSACQDTPIYILSVPPVWTGGEKGRLTNENVNSFNFRLELFALENGCVFIDTASYLKDSTGGLARPYCSDKYVHFTNQGCKALIRVLKAYDGYKMEVADNEEELEEEYEEEHEEVVEPDTGDQLPDDADSVPEQPES